MTSSYKYNEPQAAVRDNSMTGARDGDDDDDEHDNSMTGASGDGAFIRLLSLFNQNFGILSGDNDDDVATVENSSVSSFWYDELYADDTSSSGPCSVFNTSCNNLTGESDTYGSYSTWQVSKRFRIFGIYSIRLEISQVRGELPSIEKKGMDFSSSIKNDAILLIANG